MSLQFPAQPDVRLGNSPLVEVICQVRFPPILRIASEEPSQFQDGIRHEFPELELEHGFLLRLPGPGDRGAPAAEPQPRVYRFLTVDRHAVISLATDFFAVSTTAYVDWESFSAHLDLAQLAVQQIYAPLHATRIGLRYVNRFSPVNTGCQSIEEMFDLFRPELTAQARNEIWGEAAEMNSRLVLADGSEKLTLRSSYRSEIGEPIFVLDFDYFAEGRLPFEDLLSRCSRYNQIIYQAFRWSIRDEKLARFAPVSKERTS